MNAAYCMKLENKSKTQAVAAPLSDAAMRSKMREESTNFLWGMWIMLFMTSSLGYEAFQGFRSGKWVELGKLDSFPVPWWIAAAVALCTAVLCVCCLIWHLEAKARLKMQGLE